MMKDDKDHDDSNSSHTQTKKSTGLVDLSLDSISTASSTDSESSFSDNDAGGKTNVAPRTRPTTSSSSSSNTASTAAATPSTALIASSSHDVEVSPCGTLRHRIPVDGATLFPFTADYEAQVSLAAPTSQTGLLEGHDRCESDSDSEHGLIPRGRRRHHKKSTPFPLSLPSWPKSFKRPYLFYALALCVGLSSIGSIRTTLLEPNRSSVEWKTFIQHQVPILRKTLSKSKHRSQDDYTILLRGGRLDLMQQSLDSFSQCSSVRSIHVNYVTNDNGFPTTTEGDDIPIALLAHARGKAVRSSSEPMSTDAVFLLDEGILFSCRELEKGFQTWKNDPSRLVGFFGYRGMNSEETGLMPVVSGSGSYAFVSDRAVFSHKAYLESLPVTSSEETTECCDVSLSLKVSVALGIAPVVLKAKPVSLLEGSMVGRAARYARAVSNQKNGNGRDHRQTRGRKSPSLLSDCSCVPTWLQLDDLRSIPHSQTAVLA